MFNKYSSCKEIFLFFFGYFLLKLDLEYRRFCWSLICSTEVFVEAWFGVQKFLLKLDLEYRSFCWSLIWNTEVFVEVWFVVQKFLLKLDLEYRNFCWSLIWNTEVFVQAWFGIQKFLLKLDLEYRSFCSSLIWRTEVFVFTSHDMIWQELNWGWISLKFGDGDGPNLCISSTFIKNIFRSGLTLFCHKG